MSYCLILTARSKNMSKSYVRYLPLNVYFLPFKTTLKHVFFKVTFDTNYFSRDTTYASFRYLTCWLRMTTAHR